MKKEKRARERKGGKERQEESRKKKEKERKRIRRDPKYKLPLTAVSKPFLHVTIYYLTQALFFDSI